MNSAEYTFCACGHSEVQHYWRAVPKAHGCHHCSCDVRPFEIQQGTVHYRDTDERLSIGEHLRRRSERKAGGS